MRHVADAVEGILQVQTGVDQNPVWLLVALAFTEAVASGDTHLVTDAPGLRHTHAGAGSCSGKDVACDVSTE